MDTLELIQNANSEKELEEILLEANRKTFDKIDYFNEIYGKQFFSTKILKKSPKYLKHQEGEEHLLNI